MCTQLNGHGVTSKAELYVTLDDEEFGMTGETKSTKWSHHQSVARLFCTAQIEGNTMLILETICQSKARRKDLRAVSPVGRCPYRW